MNNRKPRRLILSFHFWIVWMSSCLISALLILSSHTMAIRLVAVGLLAIIGLTLVTGEKQNPRRITESPLGYILQQWATSLSRYGFSTDISREAGLFLIKHTALTLGPDSECFKAWERMSRAGNDESSDFQMEVRYINRCTSEVDGLSRWGFDSND